MPCPAGQKEKKTPTSVTIAPTIPAVIIEGLPVEAMVLSSD